MSEWRIHEGGANPAPGQYVDLVWGYGVIEHVPSSEPNWACRWKWKPSASGVTPTPAETGGDA